MEVDAICDGRDVFVPGIMELVERTGIHSGDSISVYPAFSISNKVKGIILQYAKKLGLGIGIVGLYNIQFIVDKDENVFVIEVNPGPQGPCLSFQGHRIQPGGHSNRSHPGKEPQGTGHIRHLSGRKEALVCKGAGVLFQQDKGHRRLSFAGNEVHRRGHRLRRQAQQSSV